MGTEPGHKIIAVEGVEEVLQRVDERLVGNPHVVVAAPIQDERPSVVGGSRDLGRQSRLADARFAGNKRDCTITSLGEVQQVGQHFELPVPAGERKLSVRPQHRVERSTSGNVRIADGSPVHLVCDHGFREAFELHRSQRGQLVTVATTRQDAYDVGDQDLAALGTGTQSGGLDYWGAEAVAVIPRDVARADPDAHGRSAVAVPVGDGDRLLHCDRGRDRARRASERGDDAVAHSLDDFSTVLQDEFGQQPIVSAAETVGRVLADRHPQLRRADQVRDQDRDGSRIPHRSQRTQRASGQADKTSISVSGAQALDESRLELGGQRGRQRITRFVSLTTDLRSSR